MLDRTDVLRRSINLDIFKDHARPECQAHFGEIAGHLMPGEFDALMTDLDAYARVGLVTPRLEDMKRRAECVADADRIIARLDALIDGEPN